MDDVSTYLINLDGSDARLAAATAQLNAQNIAFERLPAFDARGKDPLNFAEYDPARAASFFNRALTGGEIGCYKSHLLCAERFLQSGTRFGLVLEDDMQLSPQFAQVMSALTTWLAEQPDLSWDLINLGRAPHRLFSPLATLADHRLSRAHYFPVTTTALLWSRPGAQRFVQTNGQIYAPVDHFFRKWCAAHNGGLGLSPPIVAPSGAPSDIDDNAQPRQTIINAGYLWREFKRQSTTYTYAGYNKLRFKLFGQ